MFRVHSGSKGYQCLDNGDYIRCAKQLWVANKDMKGPDLYPFNPNRFVNRITSNLPHLYMPFGVGPRGCLGQNFAMVELKVLIALIVSNFSFSLFPKYRHVPTLRLVVEPEHDVDLLVKKL
ncbi:cytochrome P450 714C2-like [Pyrus ussuriensis x Pyrus communis]|uniref:Cytochrome P450 714C2-like n=1 Tax=Pyrus ussuriensis x Pyrus communis TaxID=2448454 RepID=A0A5N5GIY6_9ROSA|nr:cytochrome P450 714C2-like [Pyrus ussuriensis x Pyrus communis]